MAELNPPLSVTALTKASGVKRDTVDLFLRGERWPQPTTRTKIERALGWPAGRIDELAADTPTAVGSSDDPGTESPSRSRGDLVAFLESAERDLTVTQRELLEQEIRAYALRRAMEIRGEL